MKKKFLKSSSRSLIIATISLIVILCGGYIASTAENWKISKTPGDKITSADWNDMAIQVQNWFSNGADVILGTAGNVGIGTDNPNKKLHIKTDPGENAEVDIQSRAGSYWGIYHDETSDELRFWNNDNKLCLSDDGTMSGCSGPGSEYVTMDDLEDSGVIFMTPSEGKHFFITSSGSSGDMGGYQGANAICNSDPQGLSGKDYKFVDDTIWATYTEYLWSFEFGEGQARVDQYAESSPLVWMKRELNADNCHDWTSGGSIADGSRGRLTSFLGTISTAETRLHCGNYAKLLCKEI